VLTGVLAAYAFARMEFAGRDQIFMLFLATLMVPTQVTLIPTYIVMSRMGWIDSYKSLIVPFLATAFSVFLLRQFFLTIPKELEEASIMDGCSKLRFIFAVIMPLSKTSHLQCGPVWLSRFLELLPVASDCDQLQSDAHAAHWSALLRITTGRGE